MPKEESPGKPTTRRYTDEEKAQAVRLVRQARAEGRESGAIPRVARQLGYGVESVRTWVKDADVADGTAGPDAQRVVELEAQNRELASELRELRRANEILKRASLSSRRSSTAHRSDRRVHRRASRRVRSRAHLQSAADGSEHVLRRQEA